MEPNTTTSNTGSRHNAFVNIEITVVYVDLLSSAKKTQYTGKSSSGYPLSYGVRALLNLTDVIEE
ncbi:hypothetical protein KIN20_026503 [Parelaphostrongylus tenuis]|uniref:Uncharacterized protein n=1 Tax=Parelaphostrongylus tenuis TaxID=148309 RepID=A0AAD5QY51_PARTN|nr:hypothetical protein KIN20_026503 [Parelaphostrongylus tenuis]